MVGATGKGCGIRLHSTAEFKLAVKGDVHIENLPILQGKGSNLLSEFMRTPKSV